MVTGLPSLTLWAQRPTILHTMQTFIGYSPVSAGMKDTDLKYLTLKKSFLASFGLRQAPQRNPCLVSILGQWGKIALFPSDFIVKNQLARECSQSVCPVTIPALTTIVDRQFKEDSTLCPVRALRYYLDRTKDLRGSWSLLFISFKKGHTSDIRPATLSSWLKQTILLCYKQADRQALDLVQSSSGTTGPRPFPSELSSSERKGGGGGGGGGGGEESHPTSPLYYG